MLKFLRKLLAPPVAPVPLAPTVPPDLEQGHIWGVAYRLEDGTIVPGRIDDLGLGCLEASSDLCVHGAYALIVEAVPLKSAVFPARLQAGEYLTTHMVVVITNENGARELPVIRP